MLTKITNGLYLNLADIKLLQIETYGASLYLHSIEGAIPLETPVAVRLSKILDDYLTKQIAIPDSPREITDSE